MDAHKAHILIVEDNPDDEALLMRQLNKAGLGQHVKVIDDGKVAIDFLTAPDAPISELIAIFLDLRLPHMSGLQVLEKIRANDPTKNLPVIVMTSSNAPTDLEKCKKLGVSCYVQKPVTFTTFTKAVADSFHVPSTATGPMPTKLNE